MTAVPELILTRTVADLREQVAALRNAGKRIGFVPTMGALHEGHLALAAEARRRSDAVVGSVFVNPTQFAAHEDLGTYPRQEARDAELLAGAGCSILFAPDAAEMYPNGFATSVQVGGPSEGLETDFRPHFFSGVAVVVAKLLNQVQADVAVFGEKDYQQLMVVRRMARDLDIPTEIVGAPTVRDTHGLALSSRNAYLSAEELTVARRLNVILREAADRAAAGEPVETVEMAAAGALIESGFAKVDYVAIRYSETLAPFSGAVDASARILAAAWLGKTRLIDNMAVTA
ncbi:pantoate--beta-alanine ligase [Brevundimonas sp.]|uniref:pantoate--beta-alanine ligase n=1 Tax=Brevundimonas sp. TaxID=1871086 RepID=UPI001DD547F4|nr:pantoate--beta-alanine ligase [Brevundimonas sp.]MBA4000674.1 pantoate--beta-alanine ligase [Brevundimonas sp.]